jgi:hypothetical protein
LIGRNRGISGNGT